jgi:peptidoglycan/xylan/chitin deacetylase (PgdA/CDA1 family)
MSSTTMHTATLSAPTSRSRPDALPRASRRRRTRQRAPLAALAMMSLLALVLGACASGATGPSGTPSPAPTATAVPAGAAVKVFFARHPDTDVTPTAVLPVIRATTATATQERATFALQEMLKGPTQAERSAGYYSPFDGQLALQSVCSGPFRDFDLTLDRKGATAEPGTATLKFCRRVDIPGDLDGPRMAAMITTTLTQFASVKKVVILDYQGNCFDDARGLNACLDGKPTGYAVKVFFSKHPTSDDDPTAVFPLARTSPTLGVATFALGELLKGPTQAERAQGYYSPFEGQLALVSYCTGPFRDFDITLDHRGATAEPGTATVKFCRRVDIPGELAGPRMLTTISATLTQFPNIKRVVVLNYQGNCFADLRGDNACLKTAVPGNQTPGPPLSTSCTPASGVTAVSATEIARGNTVRKQVALTFDAGGEDGVRAASILDTLRAKGVRATFFVEGEWASQSDTYRGLVRRMASEGHEIGNHTLTHPYSTTLADAAFCAELNQADRVISGIDGRTTRPLWRPPYGDRDARIRALAAGLGYRTIYWTVDPRDWDASVTEQMIYDRVMTGVQPGAIVLLHVGGANTWKVLPRLIDGIKAAGYQPALVSTVIS